MSGYHNERNHGRVESEARTRRVGITREVAVSLEGIRQRAKEGLLALCVEVGLETLQALFEAELEEKIGEKGKHSAGRLGFRHGYETRRVTLCGRKVEVNRPWARTVDGKELALETYELFRGDDVLARCALERMIHGLSTRNYGYALEDVGEGVKGAGISRSTITRRFAYMTTKALQKMLSMPLDDLDIVVLYIDYRRGHGGRAHGGSGAWRRRRWQEASTRAVGGRDREWLGVQGAA